MINCQSNCADNHRHKEHRAGEAGEWGLCKDRWAADRMQFESDFCPDPPCDIESVLSLLCSGPICRGKGRRERSLRSLPAPIFPGTEGCLGQAGGRGEVTSESCS